MKKARIIIPYEENKNANIISITLIFSAYSDISMDKIGDLIKEFRTKNDFYYDVNAENVHHMERFFKEGNIKYKIISEEELYGGGRPHL